MKYQRDAFYYIEGNPETWGDRLPAPQVYRVEYNHGGRLDVAAPGNRQVGFRPTDISVIREATTEEVVAAAFAETPNGGYGYEAQEWLRDDALLGKYYTLVRAWVAVYGYGYVKPGMFR